MLKTTYFACNYAPPVPKSHLPSFPGETMVSQWLKAARL